MNLRNRISRLVDQVRQIRRPNDPLDLVRDVLTLALMDQSVVGWCPEHGGKPTERQQALLDRITALEYALDTGDVSGVDLTIYPPGYTTTREP